MELDDELRQLFTTDDRLDVPVRPKAEEIIVAGARRVRRRRIVVATASGGLAIALVVAGVVLAGGRPDAMPPATGMSTTTQPPASTVQVTSLASSTGTAGSTGTATSAATTTSSSESSSTISTETRNPRQPMLNYEVLGPTGLRTLQLGQSLSDARATGMVGPLINVIGPGGCATYDMTYDGSLAGQLIISDTVQAISAAPVRTPEGVGRGSTVEQVKAVYPDFEPPSGLGTSTVHVPGNAGAIYRLGVMGGKVNDVSLQFANIVDCGG